jgi:hypothetical protein
MLKSYEAIYSHGRLNWINQAPPDPDKETRVVVVIEMRQESPEYQESIQELLRRTRGSMEKGKTLDEIDKEIRVMRDEWKREWE